MQIRIDANSRIVLCLGLVLGCAWGQVSIAASQSNNQSGKLQQLNYGYGMLYSNASGLAKVSDLLYVKSESDKVEHIVDAISNYADNLAEQLEKLHKRYPAIEINATGLPEIAEKKLSAVEEGRVKSLAPLVGKTGKDFERTLLLSMSGALNQERHLAEVMVNAERDGQRKKFLKRVKSHYNTLYQRDLKLLKANYFCK